MYFISFLNYFLFISFLRFLLFFTIFISFYFIFHQVWCHFIFIQLLFHLCFTAFYFQLLLFYFHFFQWKVSPKLRVPCGKSWKLSGFLWKRHHRKPIHPHYQSHNVDRGAGWCCDFFDFMLYYRLLQQENNQVKRPTCSGKLCIRWVTIGVWFRREFECTCCELTWPVNNIVKFYHTAEILCHKRYYSLMIA